MNGSHDTDLYNQILNLRALRSYADRPVDPADLERLIEAARWTGSSKNRQNWSFVVVDDPDQKAALATAGDFTDPIRNAPMAIALVEEPEGYEFDTGRLAQNIMLAADALGMATCPITLHRDEMAFEVLGLPEGRRCRYAIAIGYPSPSAAPGKMGGRKPVEELLHRNRYVS
ncbi:MAG: nitroreductase family protein [Acidimicrobiia bacterium]|nr:nitroreductase family protein [Acidimicrobiia bacterium]